MAIKDNLLYELWIGEIKIGLVLPFTKFETETSYKWLISLDVVGTIAMRTLDIILIQVTLYFSFGMY